MRVFVMFGTQDKRFDRLLDVILTSKVLKDCEVHMQVGYTKGEYTGIEYQEYYTEEDLIEEIALADLIITHAGVGSIVSALKLNKKVIVVPRLGKYKEQNNDHQVQIMERFASQGYIIPVMDESTLDIAIKESETFITKPYVTESQGIVMEIRDFINKEVKKG